jgi:hypothetical protein
MVSVGLIRGLLPAGHRPAQALAVLALMRVATSQLQPIVSAKIRAPGISLVALSDQRQRQR